MSAVTFCSDLGAQKNKVSHCFHYFPIYFPWRDGTGCHDLSFLVLGFKPTFSLSSFTLINRLFSSSLLSAMRVMSSAYLNLLIFLPAVLTAVCALSSPAFLVMLETLVVISSDFFCFFCFGSKMVTSQWKMSLFSYIFSVNSKLWDLETGISRVFKITFSSLIPCISYDSYDFPPNKKYCAEFRLCCCCIPLLWVKHIFQIPSSLKF